MRLGPSLVAAVWCALVVLYGGARVDSVPLVFKMPNALRSEGRITLEFEKKSQKSRWEYAFSEVIDSETKRSKITIGQSTYVPEVYYSRGDVTVTQNWKTNRYEQVTGTGVWPTDQRFVPELDWYLKLTYTDEELSRELPVSDSHYMGPSGIMLMLMKHQTEHNRREQYRNIRCSVQAANYSRTKSSSILLENFVPEFAFLQGLDFKDMNYFSVRETVRNIKDPDDNGGGLAGPQINAILTLDYFALERIDKSDSVQLERLERDLSMPLGAGVSEFLKPYKLDETSNSFMMTYEDQRGGESGGGGGDGGQLTMLAYDHEFNYLRKESVGSSVAVWDLNEDLLYHVDSSIQGSLRNALDIEVPREQCSVLSVAEDDDGGDAAAMSRPYAARGTSLKLTEFLGATRLVYMARSSVRDLPCSVFETVLAEAPKVFQLELAQRVDKSGSQGEKGERDYDFIVQYYLLDTSSRKHLGLIAGANEIELMNESFWPARVNLYRRTKSTGASELVSSLEIHEFHLGLYGWTRKPSQLFMMPACFDEEDEQLRIALEFDFRPQPLGAEDQKSLALSKYKLEFDLMNELFRTLDLSRLHMTEYNFGLERRNQVIASFVISDRMQDKRVSYFGEGELPKSDSYETNRIELQAGHQNTAAACLMGAAHVKDVSLVIHCPGGAGGNDWPTCTVVFGETQPVVKLSKATGDRDGALSCQAYLFEAREPPKSGVKSVESHRQELQNFQFEFQTTKNGGQTGKNFILRVRDFEVTRAQQLITISNYHFALPDGGGESGAPSSDDDDTELAPASESASGQAVQQQRRNVRHIDSIAYESPSDCARICDLDANCRSYSYCRRDDKKQQWDLSQEMKLNAIEDVAKKSAAAPVRCVLSSLDLRTNNIDKQLMNAQVDTSNNQIEVKDLELAAKGNPLGVYKLEMVSGCDVHERDIMSMFAPTEELVRVDARVLELVLTATSASDCARRVVALEAIESSASSTSASSSSSSSRVGASFAYCPQTQACITDENLFASVEAKGPTGRGNNGGGDDDEDANEDAGPKQAACEMYRKRYQTYFHMSPKVVKRISDKEGGGEKPAHAKFIKHIDLNLGTVEECAHACWQSYGHVCLSFDYCSPGLCSINIVNDEKSASFFDAASIEYESRAGCLGYRRDLRWDQLRREHLIGSHNPLGVELARPAARGRGRGIFLNLVIMCLSAALFAAGLLVGRIFNDQLEIATSTWRSSRRPTNEGDSHAPTASSFARSTFGLRNRANERLSTNSKFNIENEIYEDPDAIRLEDFGGQNGATDELEEDDAGASELPAASTSTAPAEKKPTDDQRRAGFMDVPDLM